MFSADGQSAALLRHNGLIQVVDLATGNVRFQASFIIQDLEPEFSMSHFTSLQFAPDRQSLAFVRSSYDYVKLTDGECRFAATQPKDAIVWLDSRSGRIRREIEVPGPHAGILCFSLDWSNHRREHVVRSLEQRGDPSVPPTRRE